MGSPLVTLALVRIRRPLCGLPAKLQVPAGGVHGDRVARLEAAFEDLLRQRVLELLLDRALERAGTVDRVETDVAEQVERPVAQGQRQLALGQALAQVHALDARDL